MLDEGVALLKEYFNDAFLTDSQIIFFKSLPLSELAIFLGVVKKRMVERHAKLRERAQHPGRRWHRIRQLMEKLPVEEALVAKIDDWLIRCHES